MKLEVETMSNEMNRRKFLKLTGAAVLEHPLQERWADVVAAAAVRLHRPLLKKRK